MLDLDQKILARVVLPYAFLAGLWIFLSDWLLAVFVKESAHIIRLQTYLGFIFIVVTSLLIYYLFIQGIPERKRLLQLLKERQRFLQQVLDTEPGVIYLFDLVEGRHVFLNRQGPDAYGYAPKEIKAIGNDLIEHLVHPNDRVRLREHHESWRMTREPQEIREIEYRVRAKSGEWRWCHSYETAFLRDPEGRVRQVLGIAQNVSARKRLDLWRDGQNRVLTQLVAGAPLRDVLENVVLAMEAQIPGALGSILLLDADERRLYTGAAPHLPEALGRALDGMAIGPKAGACGTAAYEREPVVIEDFETDPRGEAYREMSRHFQLRACWSQPVLSVAGEVLGTFAMYYREPRRPTEAAQRLIAEAGNLVAVAIETTRNRVAVHESEQRLRATFEQAAVGVGRVAPDGHWLEANQKLCDILGYTAEELSQRRFQDITHAHDLEADLALARQLLDGEIKTYRMEKRYIRKDGTPVWVNLSVSLVREPDGRPKYFVAVIEDITERKQLIEQLRDNARQLETLSRRLLVAQETERRRIAHELHDEIGQLLTVVKLDLQTLLRRQRLEKLAPAMKESLEAIDRAVARVRDLSLDLRPSMLDDLGLVPTLRWYVQRRTQHLGTNVDLHLPASLPRLPPDVETASFRIAQEALTNALRHAGASRIDVTLAARNGDAELTVHDNGRGFDLATARRGAATGAGFGLLGMMERAQLAGGHLSIDSRPGDGTTIQARFPLTTSEAA